MIGTGLTPEGVFQNAVVFDLMNENAYRAGAVDLPDWVARYASRRYGARQPAALEQLGAAWQTLRQTAYNGSDGEMVSRAFLYWNSVLFRVLIKKVSSLPAQGSPPPSGQAG